MIDYSERFCVFEERIRQCMSRRSQIFTIALIGSVLFFFCFLNLRSIPEGVRNAADELRDRQEEGDWSLAEKSQILSVAIGRNYFDQFSWKYGFISQNGLICRFLGYDQVNGVTRLKDGQLTTLMEEADATGPAQRTISFAALLKKEDIPFLFVQSPSNISKVDPQLPTGIEDYTNVFADAFLELLCEYNVENLDTRKVLEEQEESYRSFFFRTDHHWKSEGAFLAFQAIAERLEDMLSVEIPQDYTDRSSYEEVVYKEWFLGSHGKRTGPYYAGVDDIEVLYPKFETELQVSIPSENIVRTGSFEEAVLDWSNIEPKDYFGANCYHVYIGEEYPLVHMRNESAPIHRKILLIKDSTALPVQAFLSTCFEEVDAIDLRLYDGMTVMDYVRESGPDMVMVMYHPYMLGEERTYIFE